MLAVVVVERGSVGKGEVRARPLGTSPSSTGEQALQSKGPVSGVSPDLPGLGLGVRNSASDRTRRIGGREVEDGCRDALTGPSLGVWKNWLERLIPRATPAQLRQTRAASQLDPLALGLAFRSAIRPASTASCPAMSRVAERAPVPASGRISKQESSRASGFFESTGFELQSLFLFLS